MSLILDALRRADRARERDVAARVAQALPPRTPRASPWPWVVLLAAVVVAAAIAFGRGRVEPVPETAAPPAPVAQAPRAVAGSSLAEIRVPAASVTADAAPQPAPARDALPAALRASLPQVSLDAHVWSDEPAKRFVMVRGRLLRVGDDAGDGLVVTAIVPDGAEFAYRGTRFRVPAR